MSGITVIAGRELKSFFVMPVAYVVLTLFALLSGFFFLSKLLDFNFTLMQLQNNLAFDPGAADQMLEWNLNDALITPYLASLLSIFLFLVPGITMGSFSSEKTNGTDELLLTSPLSIGSIVLGKYLAVVVLVTLLVGMAALFPGLLFLYGDPAPDLGLVLAGLLGLYLVGLLYAAVGLFASSLTHNQIIAFFLAFALSLGLLLMELAVGDGARGLGGVVGYLSMVEHFDNLLRGVVDTGDLGYFFVMIGSFLLLSKASVESVRWR